MIQLLSFQRAGAKDRNNPRKDLKGGFVLKNDCIKSGSSYSTDYLALCIQSHFLKKNGLFTHIL